jgi:hypothetical protein
MRNRDDDDARSLPIASERLRWPDGDTRGHCVGCGYFAYVNGGVHRDDCSAMDHDENK